MQISRIFTAPDKNPDLAIGDWAEFTIDNFKGAFHVSFIGTITAMGSGGRLIGEADIVGANYIQVSAHEKETPAEFYAVKQGHVEQSNRDHKNFVLVVRYQVQEAGYIEIRTYDPCTREIFN